MSRAWVATFGSSLTIGSVPSVQAGFVDFNPDPNVTQTASWPQPSKIKIFIPPELAGDNRMNFEMGINAIVDCLTQITVNYENGNPPSGATNAIDVNIVPMVSNGGELGLAEPGAVFDPPDEPHGEIDGGTISIDDDALGNSNLLKNLGAHEFGHMLGLDDTPRTMGPRTNVMDPDFNASSPFVGLSAGEKTMLMQHYTVVPEPLAGAAGLLLCPALAARRRPRHG
jgi:hypothetical protein